jgi:hypothetical protein
MQRIREIASGLMSKVEAFRHKAQTNVSWQLDELRGAVQEVVHEVEAAIKTESLRRRLKDDDALAEPVKHAAFGPDVMGMLEVGGTFIREVEANTDGTFDVQIGLIGLVPNPRPPGGHSDRVTAQRTVTVNGDSMGVIRQPQDWNEPPADWLRGVR